MITLSLSSVGNSPYLLLLLLAALTRFCLFVSLSLSLP